ncbi:hypothetical protein BKH42_03440 [Helicobacter sp. 13S00482-2]|uniref:hypothetical protein n=1 Tax=Helicobacter sp. 13S00482-2 TaxID=1476200 RepID=UPI000BA6D1A6|nr:hypothetical protein [Helicobacter sp. 13S00482-2]PAF53794.1 hypothetical protein BKH42_03440 [Helicobacter sp. 13S00482-2]
MSNSVKVNGEYFDGFDLCYGDVVFVQFGKESNSSGFKGVLCQVSTKQGSMNAIYDYEHFLKDLKSKNPHKLFKYEREEECLEYSFLADDILNKMVFLDNFDRETIRITKITESNTFTYLLLGEGYLTLEYRLSHFEEILIKFGIYELEEGEPYFILLDINNKFYFVEYEYFKDNFKKGENITEHFNKLSDQKWEYTIKVEGVYKPQEFILVYISSFTDWDFKNKIQRIEKDEIKRESKIPIQRCMQEQLMVVKDLS